MSIHYYAYAVIGCELPVDKLYKKVVIEHVVHEVPPGAAFCPVCGEPARIEVQKPIFDEDDEKLGEFQIIWATGRKQAFIGQFVGGTIYKTEHIEITDLESLKASLQKVLEPLGLWNEKAFRLYAVMYCSC